jgi:hypothetical protein
MISHSIIIKEIKHTVYANASALVNNQEELDKYIKDSGIQIGDFLCYGTIPIAYLVSCYVVVDLETKYEYLESSTYHKHPKFVKIMTLGQAFDDITRIQLPRYESIEHMRHLTSTEISKFIVENRDNILDRCEANLGPEITAKIKALS